MINGRLAFCQYIKNKKHKYGVNFFELCTNVGFNLRADIYSGEKFADKESLGQIAVVDVHLIKPYLYKGYHIFAGNWHNSVALSKYMSRQKNLHY